MTSEKIPGRTQVIIVGAGPTGLSLAAQLIRYNIDFVIIEKNEKTTIYSKAVVVQARSLEIFDEIGIADKAIQEGRLTTAFNVFYKGKQKAKIDISGLGDGLSPFPFALSLEQSKTEKLLVDYLSSKGKEIQWKCEFTRFEQNDGIRVYYKDLNGIEKVVEGEYLVGCDGAGSVVRHQMGLEFPGDTITKLFYVADVKLSSAVINKDELFAFLIEKGFVLFFPMEGDGHYRVIGILPDAKDTVSAIKFEEIEISIREKINVDVTFDEVIWFSTYKVHSRMADSFMGTRSFIAGDAAHIHTPAGGQGMNTGIQDGYNLAWKIAFTLQKKVNEKVLESYNTERMENARHLLKTTDKMFDFIAGMGSFWNFIRLNIFPFAANFISKTTALNKLIFPLLSQIGIAYPNSILTVRSSIGKINSGDRMPYFIFRNGGNIFDQIKEPDFKILFFGKADQSEFDQFNIPKIEIKKLAFDEIPADIFSENSNFYILLRPDNHISYIGKDLKICREQLEKISSK